MRMENSMPIPQTARLTRSFGPTIRYPHSPDEKVNIESVVRFWQLLLATIENVPVK